MGVESLKLVSLNVKGISNFQKRKTIYTWCRRKNADFSFLQETEVETQWKNEWAAGIIMSHGSSNSRGVAILIKKGIDYTLRSKIVDASGRYIILKVVIKDKICLDQYLCAKQRLRQKQNFQTMHKF